MVGDFSTRLLIIVAAWYAWTHRASIKAFAVAQWAKHQPASYSTLAKGAGRGILWLAVAAFLFAPQVSIPSIAWPSINWPTIFAPVAPVVTPDKPSPVTVTGKRFAIIAESGDGKSTEAQAAIFSDSKLRTYVDSHAEKVNGVAEFRILDPNTVLIDTPDNLPWKQMLDFVKGEKLPLMVATDGKVMKVKELGKDTDETLAFFKTIGGE